MIKFFRKIRKKLLSENKYSKYIFYAIGEIVLVVIGIIIALWINNLNIIIQKKIEETNILKELKNDFKKDKVDFKINIKNYKNISLSVDIILNHLESSKVYHDSLDLYFAKTISWPRSVIQTSSLDVLKSKGVDLISNDSLRKEILNFHGIVYTSIKNWENQFNRNVYFEEIIKRFDKVEPFNYDENGDFYLGSMKPNNYNALKTDVLYMSVLRTMKRDAEYLMYGRYLKIIQELEGLINKIDKELSHLE